MSLKLFIQNSSVSPLSSLFQKPSLKIRHVWDAIKSFGIDKESMHLVEHHDDLYS